MNDRLPARLALAALMGAVTAGPASAQEFPNRPITLVVNFAAGGTTDLSARLLADRLSDELDVPVNVENRGGGGGTAGIGYVARADPDGYTIGTITASPVTTLYYTQDLDFHPIEDLTYLAQYATTYHPVAVRADSEFDSLEELVAYAEENPGELTYSTAGTLNQAHLAMEQMARAEDIEMTFAPYSEGGAAAMTALLGGHVDAVVVSDFSGPLEAGKIKLLAETSETSIEGYPDVPTFEELGYDFGSVALVGIIAPDGLEENVRTTLEDALMSVIQSSEFAKQLKRLNMTPIARGGAAFRDYASNALESTGKILQELQSSGE